ncbi:hypothetical protein LPU83_pLPU83d_1567 (plasmid) [Rhizobium favelukesii]|uniref:Uncharacterized protein n=1 Tax=Rhizobium favelukesii TaxID=348824 RepID=W6RPH5_9HYPH|nr:hypothetical protein LPU83_pLPU83d_1567 [Rhizobium favelukesii]
MLNKSTLFLSQNVQSLTLNEIKNLDGGAAWFFITLLPCGNSNFLNIEKAGKHSLASLCLRLQSS